MRLGLRYFLVDREGVLYRLPSATLDRMQQVDSRLRLPRLAGQRVRSAEVAVEMINGRPVRIIRSVFYMLTFKSDGALLPTQQDRHPRSRVELPLARAPAARRAGVTEASTRFVARAAQWTPPAPLLTRIPQLTPLPQKSPPIPPPCHQP